VKAGSGTAPPTAWARQRERSSLWQLRLMRRIAVSAGRRAARLMLHPIVCFFCLDQSTRHHSARYLSRALGRSATWGDVYTHLFTFAAMVLDRVYLLQERFDEFTFTASGVEAMHGRRRARVRRPPRQLRGAAHDRPRARPAGSDDHV
jgi:predicted LPLAT superfamily acyltransferase